ncbi:c-type cytochrome biogenesis protein CcmI [Pseudomonas oryzihabitans]|uniref:c-type cytochrome biogenesis protein CcmI n=1 Tax=Pseudomonas oryzihabitans TaxID=47885 RepID=UPI00285719C7|nr:c-type cytochrome biogenesis protein CcmI [Pseudomonas psychrotolerans]MDR6675964.1 cytochrome c-type biogenesis protein CcmH [Pseudomonas psychrotolerans]
MLAFWGLAGLLSILAVLILLIPLLRGGRTEKANRAALNRALYRERLAEVQARVERGELDAQAVELAEAEAVRSLLADSAVVERAPARRGRRLGIAVAFMVPALALGLYLLLGALPEFQLSQRLAEPPRSPQALLATLEEATRLQPQAADNWYLLARAYAGLGRYGEAVTAFEQVIQHDGRRPEVLGQLAQARFFAAGRKLDAQTQALADEALQANPVEPTTLGLLGIAAYERGDYAQAARHWQRLSTALAPGDPLRQALAEGIGRAERAAQAAGQSKAPGIEVEVSLAPEVAQRVRPGDSVFVLALAEEASGPPLAVRRLRVADLPARVRLDDGDAMLPQRRLSDQRRVRPVVVIARNGDPLKGDWRHEGEPLDLPTATLGRLRVVEGDALTQ